MSKLERRIARKTARQQNGDFSALVGSRPLDPELRRLTKPVLNAKRTRKTNKQ